MKRFIAIALALVCANSFAEESLTVGGSYSAQGCVDAEGVEATKVVHATYQRTEESFDVNAYVRRAPRGADCREDGVTVDLGIERQFNVGENAFANVSLGYDQHGVTGFDGDNTLVFGSVKQEIAAIGIGSEIANVEFDVAWNIPTAQPRFAIETSVIGIDLSADHLGGYTNVSASYFVELFESWGVTLTARHSAGFDKLPDPFSGRADAPATNEANTVEVGITKKF